MYHGGLNHQPKAVAMMPDGETSPQTTAVRLLSTNNQEFPIGVKTPTVPASSRTKHSKATRSAPATAGPTKSKSTTILAATRTTTGVRRPGPGGMIRRPGTASALSAAEVEVSGAAAHGAYRMEARRITATLVGGDLRAPITIAASPALQVKSALPGTVVSMPPLSIHRPFCTRRCGRRLSRGRMGRPRPWRGRAEQRAGEGWERQGRAASRPRGGVQRVVRAPGRAGPKAGEDLGSNRNNLRPEWEVLPRITRETNEDVRESARQRSKLLRLRN